MVLDAVNSSMTKILEPYKKWVTANPQLLADIESTVKCLSYFTAGRFNNSTLASELIYSVPNLIVLFNDLIMYSNKCIDLKLPQFESKIKIWLTVIEYTETLFEISAKKVWGRNGKWFIITVIQLFKAVLRLSLVYKYKEQVTKSPPIQPLNREQLNKSGDEKLKEGFKLKRSGTVVRSIKASSSIDARMWEPLSSNVNDNYSSNRIPASGKNMALAETLYITKPLFHLGCISLTGENQWPPWLLSLIIDLISLKIFNEEAKAVPFSKEDQKEFYRRKLSLLLYILRSPFYDKYSRVKIYAALTVLAARVPLARFVANPVKKYLPHWQSIYFYMWSC